MNIFSNALWSISFVFGISKSRTFLFILTSVFRKIVPIALTLQGARIIDILLLGDVTKEQKISLVITNILILFGIIVSERISIHINAYSSTYLSQNIRFFGTERIYQKAADLTLEQLENPEINNLMMRASESVRKSLDLFRSVVHVISIFTGLVADLLIIVAFLPFYILAYILGSLLYYFSIRRFIRKDFEFRRKWTEEERRAWTTKTYLSESLYLKDIKINDSFNFFDGLFKSFRIKYLDGYLRIVRSWEIAEFLSGLPMQIVYFFGYVSTVIAYIENFISLGTMTFRFASLTRFNTAVSALADEMSFLSQFSIDINEFRKFLELKPQEKNFRTFVTGRAPEIEINNLSFNYARSEKEVIKNLNLKIEQGEKIAIVGENGAGKTTLIKLLSKLYDVEKGEILVNGVNLNEISYADHFENMGVIFQDFFNYESVSIKQNIALDQDEKISMEKVRAAVELADATEFIEALPNQYETIPSERFKGGIRLSGGQSQKLALARFFYKDAPLLIFDEPTSAIDAKSEFKIFNNIYEFFKDKTVVIISHRFSTVKNADRIIVMSDGEIAEEGTHDDLMKKNGIYAEAYKLQVERM